MNIKPKIKYLRKNFDELTILAALGKVAVAVVVKGDVAFSGHIFFEQQAVLRCFLQVQSHLLGTAPVSTVP